MLNPDEVILMREKRDCHVPVIAMATGNTYEVAAKALNHKRLGGLESPIFSNPWNLYRSLIRLGFWKKNITWRMLKKGQFIPNKTIVLVKNSLLEQHWVLHGGLQHMTHGNPLHIIYWGNSKEPIGIHQDDFKKMFLTSIPICAFQVYEANFWELMLVRFLSWFGYERL